MMETHLQACHGLLTSFDSESRVVRSGGAIQNAGRLFIFLTVTYLQILSIQSSCLERSKRARTSAMVIIASFGWNIPSLNP